jgi:hypothetical protein
MFMESKEIRESIPVKYHFNDQEKLDIGAKLAQANQRLAQLEDEKKRRHE